MQSPLLSDALLGSVPALSALDGLGQALQMDTTASIQRSAVLEALLIDGDVADSSDALESATVLHLRRQVLRQWRGFSRFGAKLGAASQIVLALVRQRRYA